MVQSFDIGIRCKYLLTMKDGVSQAQQDAFVGIRGKQIAEISPWAPEKRGLAKNFMDGDSHLVMPAFVNGHTHLPMTLFRGLGDDAPFHQWLFDLILPLEMALVDPEFVRVGTELAALECIRFGVTTVNDMYFFAETIADTWDRAGLRGWIGQPFSNGPLPEDKVLGADKTRIFERFHEKYGNHERIVPALAPHAPYTCDDEVFRKVVRLSQKHQSPIHVHLSETAKEVQDSLQAYGQTPVQRLHNLGVLSSSTVAAHCVHLNDKDIEILKSSGAAVAYNPDSNLKLGSGIAPVTRYLRQGIPVVFGTDGAASNNDLSIFGAMDLGTKLQKFRSGDTVGMVAADALSCSTWGGARALNLQKRMGSIEVGKEADVILIDLNYPHLQPIYDVRSLLVYASQGLEVDTVICQGQVLMRKGEFFTLDQEKIFASASAISTKVQQYLAI